MKTDREPRVAKQKVLRHLKKNKKPGWGQITGSWMVHLVPAPLMGKGKEKTTGPLQGLKAESQSSQQAGH